MLFRSWLVSPLKTFSMKLIISLVFADLFYSSANIMSLFRENEISCFVEGYLRSTSLISGIIWVITILKISQIQMTKYDPEMPKAYTKILILNILISLIPGTATAISVYMNGPMYFGNALGFCDILPSFYEIIFIDLPLWLIIFATAYYTYKIAQVAIDPFTKKKSREYTSALVYPFILVLLWLPSLTDRIVFYMTDRPIFYLVVIHIAASRSQGFVNALVYGKSKYKMIRNYLKGKAYNVPGSPILDGNPSDNDIPRIPLSESFV